MQPTSNATSTLQPDPRSSLYLLYHELTVAPTPYGYAHTAEAFRTQLETLKDVETREPFLVPKISFDDGHVSNFTIAAPILDEMDIRAHFFITAGWTGTRAGYMEPEQIRELAQRGHQIGAHGWSHRLLTHCSPAELQTELVRTRAMLEELLGTEVTTLSLPGGRHNASVLDACKAAGYNQVFTSVPQAAKATDQLIGRLNLRSGISTDALADYLNLESGALRHANRQYRLKAAGQQILGDVLYAKVWGLLNRAAANAEVEA